jgi:hypothetical protein
MEVGQGPNCGCSAKEEKIIVFAESSVILVKKSDEVSCPLFSVQHILSSNNGVKL